MTKSEYLTRLTAALKKSSLSDTDEIVGEYEEHFAFKLADGFSEEEIAAKLGTPESIAAQYASDKSERETGSGGKILTAAAMSFAAIFEGMFYILFFAWAIAVFAASIASAVAGGALLFRLGIGGIIPDMPYLSAAVFGVCLLSFAVLLSAVAYYSFAYTKQIVRVSIRWHKSVMSGNTLPPLPLNPQFAPKQKRRLRSVLLLSLSVFATTMVLGAILAMILSGALGFWHAWGWFVA